MPRLPRVPLKHVHPLVGKHYRYAVVGASADPEKFGHIVFFDLKHSGFPVVPVNPKLIELGGVPAVRRLQDITPPPDVAVVVVPPAVGVKILDDAKEAGIPRLWFQPGAESEEIRRKAAELGLKALANGSCIMVARRLMDV